MAKIWGELIVYGGMGGIIGYPLLKSWYYDRARPPIKGTIRSIDYNDGMYVLNLKTSVISSLQINADPNHFVPLTARQGKQSTDVDFVREILKEGTEIIVKVKEQRGFGDPRTLHRIVDPKMHKVNI